MPQISNFKNVIYSCTISNDYTFFGPKPFQIVKPGNVILVQDAELNRDDIRKIQWAETSGLEYVSFGNSHSTQDFEELENVIGTSSCLKKLFSAPSQLAGLDNLINMSDGIIVNRGILSLEASFADIIHI